MKNSDAMRKVMESLSLNDVDMEDGSSKPTAVASPPKDKKKKRKAEAMEVSKI